MAVLVTAVTALVSTASFEPAVAAEQGTSAGVSAVSLDEAVALRPVPPAPGAAEDDRRGIQPYWGAK